MPTRRTSLGNLGEELALRLLRGKGYLILGTNYRCRWGEVDIIAQQNDELVFVEVRTRSSARYGTPEESITEAKKQRLLATAQDYLQTHGDDGANWRIDLVSVRLGSRSTVESIDHLEHAVQL